ncbi:MAG: ABC transporter permease, partial [Clostridia bacterium]|nr:ABC transporter permease [Clostridia bacterium]
MHKFTQQAIRVAIYIGLTLTVAALLVLGAGADPMRCGRIFIFGIFGSLNGFAEVLVKAAPLLLAGLGISIGFRSGFFNIGAEGQMYMGAIAATAVAMAPLPFPLWAHTALAMAAAFLAGGFWAFIPGILKAKFGISEIINTLMLNYIAFDLTGVLIRGALQDSTDYLPQSPILVPELTCILEPTRLHAGFLLALVMVAFAWWLMEYTPVGFELQAVGSNKRAAKCLGINVMKSIVLASCLGGGLAGVAGAGELLGVQHRLLEGLVGSSGY